MATYSLMMGLGCNRQTTPEPLQPTLSNTTVRVDLDSRRPAEKLSEYGLFRDLVKQLPSPNVIAYALNSYSFLDQAIQQNFVYIPSGQFSTFRPDIQFDFPVGSILVQNIRFPIDLRNPDLGSRLVETRLLIHQNHGWTGVPYLWEADQSDAQRAVIGGKTKITVIQHNGMPLSFSYLTPNMNQCKQCHWKDEAMVPIGITARNLNRKIRLNNVDVDQLAHWQHLGLLEGKPDDQKSVQRIPDWRDNAAGSLDQRARAWLDVNCAHCHCPGGPAIASGLDLSFDQDNPVRFGIYKPPVAAGRGSSGLRFSILPREPEKSFLLHRVLSTELGVMMPPLGRSLADQEAAALLREWILDLKPDEALEEAALNPMLAYKDTLAGGDPERGKTIFHQTQKCINCHQVGTVGVALGPNLSDVGKRTKPDYLLESLVDPNAKIVQGFQTEVVMTDDGRLITGIVKSEDQYELVIADSNTTHKIIKDEIEERQTSPNSTMPTVANVLTVDQVRDLVAYLVTLQETPSK
jgi:uncharacterized repeat protein (TIGR03806 family)